MKGIEDEWLELVRVFKIPEDVRFKLRPIFYEGAWAIFHGINSMPPSKRQEYVDFVCTEFQSYSREYSIHVWPKAKSDS